MITQERALETLERFDIDREQLLAWEAELGLDIPLDGFGNKVYSPLHINLFKNVKKHLALGRSLEDIKRMVVLPAKSPVMTTPNPLLVERGVGDDLETALEGLEPPTQEVSHTAGQVIHASFRNTLSQRLMKELKPVASVEPVGLEAVASSVRSFPVEEPAEIAPHNVTLPTHRTARSLKRFASTPVRITSSGMLHQQGPNAGLLVLMDRLMVEKDDLQAKLLDMEKQKVHLYQTNELFQRRVKELAAEIEQLQDKLRAQENFKLMDDKSRLQKQVLAVEQRQAESEKKLQKLTRENKQLKDSLANKVNPGTFLGNWLEEAELAEIAYDNFGINIESKRNRMFRITQPPERFFGHTAIIDTTYDYQANTLWKRTESLVLSVMNENRLEGELIAEYSLDGTPVAKAVYRVKCHRNGVKSD